ncbi:MAG: outer membrane beta-barrel protein [Betaproteobacteria bacterium]|nr:outer membrane beta-barrel protein [Betaproteobacteria bacterium]
MKQLAVSAMLCMSMLPAFAGDDEEAERAPENYMGVSASRLTKGGASTGMGIMLGHRYGEYFAAEVAYEDTGALNAGSERTSAYSVAGVGYLPLTERLEAYGRLGLSTANTRDLSGAKANHGGTTYGAGLEGKVNPLYSVSVGWERVPVGDNVAIPRGNEDSYTVGLIRRF